MSAFVRVVLFVAVMSLVAAACASADAPSVESSSSSPSTTVAGVGTSGSEDAGGSSVGSGSAGEPVAVPDVDAVCADPIGVLADAGLVDVDAAAGVLEGTDVEVGPGADGAVSLLGDAPAVGLCAVEVSAAAQAALEEAGRAWAAGDGAEARRIIEEFLAGSEAWLPPGPGVWAAGAGQNHAQTARDRLAMAGEAARNGDEETAWALFREGVDEFATYLEGEGDDPGEIERAREAGDAARLLQLAAQAMLLGLEDLSREAFDAAISVVQAQLEKLMKSYDPCTASEEQKKEFLTKVAQLKLLGGTNEKAWALAKQTIDIRIRRTLGEPVPECDAASFEAFVEAAAPGFSGGITVQMRTCDGILWQGLIDEEMGFSGPGASVTWTGGGDVEVELDEDGSGTGEFGFDQFMWATAEGHSFSATMPQVGTLTLTVDRADGTVTGRMVIEATVRSGSAMGKSFSVPLPGETWNFTAPLLPPGDCD